jgi:16S rRNA (guanine966-N2)-methyltransferase
MRVVAGLARGRVLRAPAGKGTRPTSDRVREALFSVLGSLGGVDGAVVLDLFAGSGALGIEAASRGADTVTFVDRDRLAIECIKANLAVLKPASVATTVVQSDVLRWLAKDRTGFDLVLADPPYGWSEWAELLRLLEGRATLVVAETGWAWDPGPGWETMTVKRYGGTVVTVAQQVVGER